MDASPNHKPPFKQVRFRQLLGLAIGIGGAGTIILASSLLGFGSQQLDDDRVSAYVTGLFSAFMTLPIAIYRLATLKKLPLAAIVAQLAFATMAILFLLIANGSDYASTWGGGAFLVMVGVVGTTSGAFISDSPERPTECKTTPCQTTPRPTSSTKQAKATSTTF